MNQTALVNLDVDLNVAGDFCRAIARSRIAFDNKMRTANIMYGLASCAYKT